MANSKKSKINVGSLERGISLLSGGTLFFYAFKRGSLGSLLAAFLGAEFLYRGVTGHCHVYEALDLNTAQPETYRPLSAPSPPPTTERPSQSSKTVVQKTPTKTLKPEGKPKQTFDLQSLSKDELYQQAKDAQIEGRSRMSKEELIQALQKKNK